MASVRKSKRPDPTPEAAVEYFAAQSHNSWRRRLLQTDPKQKGKRRMRLRGGVMVDINQPWSKLDPRAQAENRVAARNAYAAVKKFPKDREAASDYVHRCWMKRNKKDPSQPKDLFKPYAQLPEIEKDKDRAHIDVMKKALAKVRTGALKKAPAKPRKKAPRTANVAKARKKP